MRGLLVFFTVSLALTSTAFADTGVVKWFSVSKGVGFITPDDPGRDLYFHFSYVMENNDLEAGECVRYIKGRDTQGRIEARDIVRIRCD